MTAPVFGYVPNKRSMQLSTGADFILNMVLQQGDWPTGTSLRIEVDGQVWEAAVDDEVAAWKVEAEQADDVRDGSSYRMFVRYPDDPTPGGETTDILWFYGRVKRTRT